MGFPSDMILRGDLLKVVGELSEPSGANTTYMVNLWVSITDENIDSRCVADIMRRIRGRMVKRLGEEVGVRRERL